MYAIHRPYSIAVLRRLAVGLLAPLALSASAAWSASVVIDDFEDGDSSDWGFFGGTAAGGGGGIADDRPREGSFYFSTGWGGEGSGSVFYGGGFKNLEDTAQVEPPEDPWFNVWVLNQSDATVDQYVLEITLREDLDGNGWTDGAEDSFRLDAAFTSADFNDEWTLISAPLSSFSDLATGGDGTFNGNLDEVVIVIGGVAGASGSTVELDFDQFSFTSGGPLVAPSSVVFDDMEHGDPLANGWFSFGGAVGGGDIGPNSDDLPPSDGGVFSLQTGWGSGGTPGFFGGFGRTNPVDLGGTDLGGGSTFSFWINPQEGQDYTLEINLQDDDNGDDAANAADDDEFQFNCVVSPTGPCAVSGAGWQRVAIPLTDFFYDPSFLFGGNGVLDPVSESSGGNGQLVNVVFAVIGNSGSDVNFTTDFWLFSDGPPDEGSELIDDFESGLPEGVDANGVPIGFYTFSDGSPIAIATTDTPPAPVPGSTADNNVMAMTGVVAAFAGFIHGFENETLDTWVPQDWSGSAGFRLWFYGTGSGTGMFIDILDNRNPGSTGDDAERFSVSFTDDFSGWQLLEFPFSAFARKEVGNGAPNDGFNLTQVHGWALGSLATAGGEASFYVDDAALYGTAEIPDLAVSFCAAGFDIEEGTTGAIGICLNRPMNADDPAEVSVSFATEPGTAIEGRDYIPASGTATFVNGGPSEFSFTLETIDNSKWEGTRTIELVLSDSVDVARGFTPRATVFILENDEFDPNLLDEFETFPYLWESSEGIVLTAETIAAGDPGARPGQDLIEGVLAVDGPRPVDIRVERNFCRGGPGGTFGKVDGRVRRLARVVIWNTESFDALAVDHTTVTVNGASEAHTNSSGVPKRHEKDMDRDGDKDLVLHFLATETGVECDTTMVELNGTTFDGEAITTGGSPVSLERNFPLDTDWSGGAGLSFWYYGSGSAAEVTVTLKDNRAPDPGPAGWELAWAEEFNDPAGTQPDPAIWTFEIGDGSRNGIPGWGNEEFQYYTDDPANAATDGDGNLVLTVRESDGSLDCYYGPCEYTSARLISQNKAEFAYGRIESRILVPEGGGLWPAFWSLGTDIGLVGWPQTGEIDFMEYVGRLPNEIFGTIHGPGYSGGDSFGNVYDFGEPTFNNYHTFTVEWEPDLIRWYVDGILYHSATPGDVAPNPWVFNDPVFLLLNMAIGGNFGGAIDPDIELPASMAVDYIRVYQGPDSAERFEATFTDDVAGWRLIEIPFDAFSRSADQPAGAPDDGLGLNEVWGYGFSLPDGGSFKIDQVRVIAAPAPPEIVVTSLADSGAGSLRQAILEVDNGGIITFDPGLAGGTLALTGGPFVLARDVTIDAGTAPGISLDGGAADRLVIVEAGAEATLRELTITNGYGFQLAGGILNNGVLTLERVTVTGNVMTTDGGDFWQGGAGIYNGENSSLTLVDSTVSDNDSGYAGGGVYSFFGTTTVIERSTISGNTAADVGGGLRNLGNLTMVNSTVSGNVSSAWHGGGIFHTDGELSLTHSTFSENVAPAGTASGVLVATFGAPASATLANTIVEGNGAAPACAIEGGGAATISSAGGNIDTDGSCNLAAAGDQPATDPLLQPLGNNGGPTETHALEAGSPAVDAADGASCPAADQRGVLRPQGGGCDIGAFELQP